MLTRCCRYRINVRNCNQTPSFLTEQVCVQLPTLAVNVVLPAFACHAVLLPSTGRQSTDVFCPDGAQQQTAAAACGRRMMGQTDGQTDGRPTVA